MKNDPAVKNFDGTQGALYPHLKITNEKFPRVLATRKIEDDGAEYFGAFLSKTATRILIDFLNKVFRLRSCDIPIDGKFSVPCTQYYHRRCLAPCVESLCTRDNYLAMVDLVRLFLANRRNELTEALQFRIQLTADALDYETAAYWRDILVAVEKYWSNPRWNVWLHDCVDTYTADETEAGYFVYLVTQRNRHVLGRKVFNLPSGGGQPPHEAIVEIIRNFYRFYVPREIRVSFDFPGRQELARQLSAAFGRTVKINVVKPDRQLITSIRALRLARAENELDIAKQPATTRQIAGELKRQFGLERVPKRVEAFDVAHISGKAFVCANASWTQEGFRPRDYQLRIGDQRDRSELTALAHGVVGRLAFPWLETPDLILIDGGKSQLNAVINHWRETNHPKAPFIAAVKPVLKHSAISYFLTENGEKIAFDADNPSHYLLQRLRDEAHDLANRAHRDLRDMRHNYELASVLPTLNEAERRRILKAVGSVSKIVDLSEKEIKKEFASEIANKIILDMEAYRRGESPQVLPLIVPIRFDDEIFSADDLRPIATR